MNPVSALFLLILIAGLFRPQGFLLYCVFLMPAFGSVAVLPPEWVGGTSFTPGSVACLFFILKSLNSFFSLQQAAQGIISIRQLGLLGLFLLIALLGAYILPHILSGQIRVIDMRTAQEEMLAPSIANITQSVYLMLSTFCVCAAFVLARSKSFTDTLLKAILAGAYAIILTGLLDWVTNTLGVSDALSLFRTANYAILSDVHLLNSLRIIGLTPEASVYGLLAASYCAMLLFMRSSYPYRLWRLQVPCAIAGCAVMTFLSRSSTAYLMLFAILAIYLFQRPCIVTPAGDIIRKPMAGKFLRIACIAVLCTIFLLFARSIASSLIDLVNTLIFEKKYSDSYIERTHWTNVAFDAFIASDGLGVGVGSVRTSNFFVNLLASTGVLGFMAFALFLLVAFLRHASKGDNWAAATIRGAKLALIPAFLGMAVSSSTPDFGALNGILLGLIVGLGQAYPGKAQPPPNFMR